MLYHLETVPAGPEDLQPGSAVTVLLPDNKITIGWRPDKVTESGLITTTTEHEVHCPRQLDALEGASELLSNEVWKYSGELSEELASLVANCLSASWGGDGQAS